MSPATLTTSTPGTATVDMEGRAEGEITRLAKQSSVIDPGEMIDNRETVAQAQLASKKSFYWYLFKYRVPHTRALILGRS